MSSIRKRATGIVRRIDDLGRIVIPKEIRRILRIREGDPLEIYTDSRGEVVFRKYSAVADMINSATQCAGALSKILELPVLITDKDHVLAVSGASKMEFLDRRISFALEDFIEARSLYSIFESDEKPLKPIDNLEIKAIYAVPILASGDVLGSIIVLSGDEKQITPKNASENFKLVKLSAEILGKQMED